MGGGQGGRVYVSLRCFSYLESEEPFSLPAALVLRPALGFESFGCCAAMHATVELYSPVTVELGKQVLGVCGVW